MLVPNTVSKSPTANIATSIKTGGSKNKKDKDVKKVKSKTNKKDKK